VMVRASSTSPSAAGFCLTPHPEERALMRIPTYRWFQQLYLYRRAATGHGRSAPGKRPRGRLRLEPLEDRTVLSVSIAATNNNGQGYAALSFNQSGGYVPPDTCGAAGPTNYVET